MSGWLLPYLPQNLIVIMDSVPNHCLQEDKLLTRYSLKDGMINWLKNKGIQVNGTVHKIDLYNFVEFNMSMEKKLRTDIKHTAFSHTRTPALRVWLKYDWIGIGWNWVHSQKNVTGDLYVPMLQAFSWRLCKFNHKRRLGRLLSGCWESSCWETDKVLPD